jgi:hypothetical protein
VQTKIMTAVLGLLQPQHFAMDQLIWEDWVCPTLRTEMGILQLKMMRNAIFSVTLEK